ncbi:MAG: MarR family transcriptional regulator [Clostridia bacterium]|nr:MarR family transcriptional regulator [Clostridia bacterium]
MKRENTIGFKVRTLSVAMRRALGIGRSDGGCTGTHGWVIGYLYDNREKAVYQRDIEKQFSVRRPTMTAILQLMEKNGLLERMRDENDARLKRICLTPLALEIHERHERDIEAFETRIREGISEEELDAFFATLDKLSANVATAENERLEKEKQ